MYLDHFNLKAKPFQITADPKFLWMGEKHKEALATLRYGIVDNRGFLLLTGEVGTGKTILINSLVSLLDIDTVVATLTDPDLESMDFYNMLADGLKMDRTFDSKGAFLIHLRDFLHQSYSRQQQVLLIIDESQRLNHRLMEDIRVLSNIELHDHKLINIFFVGQQEFNSILMTPQNRALAQRITVRYHIEPLDAKETGEYIEHRLKVAGTTRQIFTRAGLKEVYQFSGGIPRLINIICDHALLTGYARGAKQINDTIVKECAEELRIPVKNFQAEALAPVAAQAINTIPISDIPPAASSGSNKASTDGQNTAPEPANSPPNIEIEKKSATWKLAHIAMVLILIVIAIFAATHFTRDEQPRWDSDELTPKKYKNTLEREKELLSTQLNKKQTEDTTANTAAATVNDAKSPEAVVKETPKESVPGIKKLSPQTDAKSQPRSAEEPNVTASVSSDKDTQVRPAGSPDQETRQLSTGVSEIEPLPQIKENAIIFFDINSNEIAAESFAFLDRIAGYLERHSGEIVHVKGYTDASGSEGYNESVSFFRANAVKSYLIGKGVSPASIQVFAMGSQDPIAPNDTFEGRRKNRRVEIQFPHEQESTN